MKDPYDIIFEKDAKNLAWNSLSAKDKQRFIDLAKQKSQDEIKNDPLIVHLKNHFSKKLKDNE